MIKFFLSKLKNVNSTTVKLLLSAPATCSVSLGLQSSKTSYSPLVLARLDGCLGKYELRSFYTHFSHIIRKTTKLLQFCQNSIKESLKIFKNKIIEKLDLRTSCVCNEKME